METMDETDIPVQSNGTESNQVAIPNAGLGRDFRHGRFEQIISRAHLNGAELYALDTKGVVWRFVDDMSNPRWTPLVMKRAAN